MRSGGLEVVHAVQEVCPRDLRPMAFQGVAESVLLKQRAHGGVRCFQPRWWVHSNVTYGPYVTQNRKEGPHMSTKSALRADMKYGSTRANSAPAVFGSFSGWG